MHQLQADLEISNSRSPHSRFGRETEREPPFPDSAANGNRGPGGGGPGPGDFLVWDSQRRAARLQVCPGGGEAEAAAVDVAIAGGGSAATRSMLSARLRALNSRRSPIHRIAPPPSLSPGGLPG